ncbi:hypothetical protein, partial [Escherichia coli]|uniref:hypothetical protein n=1 Tax=Escherichia coli TaxID=562 RepID=UPI001BA8648D
MLIDAKKHILASCDIGRKKPTMALDNAPRLIKSNHPVPVISSSAIHRRNSVYHNMANLHDKREKLNKEDEGSYKRQMHKLAERSRRICH